jgi:uncharacterized protein involved in outer membrane biogenesis
MHAMRRPISHRRYRAPRKRRLLAAAGYGALALVCLAFGALAFVLVAPPLDAVRDRLAADVSARTGRTLTVAGPMSVALFPRVVVAFSDIALQPPEGVAGAPTLTAPSLDVETSLWSLLSRRPRLDRITLHRPTIELAIDAQGRRSWETAAPVPRPNRPPVNEARGGKAAPPGPAERSSTTTRSRRPRPWAVRLLDGTVRYRDERAGTSYEIGALNVDAAAEAAAGAVTMDGAFVWQGEPFHFSATVAAGRTGDGQLEQVALKLAGGPLEVAYRGTLSWRVGIAAEGDLSLQRLAYKDLKIGPATFDVRADAGVVKLVLREAELYGGRGQGSLTLDTGSAPPAISARLKLVDVSVLPLLKEAASVGWLDGRGSVALDLGARGLSERQIVETLQGQVQVNVADGSVAGIDIDRSLRALQRGRLGTVAPRREDRTAFRSLAGTFEIADGVARTQDLKLDSAHVEVSGEGRVELGPRRIDCTLNTKITGGPAEEGAAIKIGTVELPIVISGPLERPKFAISGQEGLSDAINQIGKNLRSREVRDALKGLLGGDGEKRVKPGELIEKLLKKD